MSDLIAVDVLGPAARNPISTRQIAARQLRSVSETTASPAWPRPFYQTVSCQVDTMIVISETEIGTVTEGTVTGTVSAIAIGNESGTGTVIANGIAIMTAHLAPAVTSL